MSYKQIEASREIRLWIGQIIVPAVTTVALVYLSNPNFKDFVDSKIDKELKLLNKFGTWWKHQVLFFSISCFFERRKYGILSFD